MYTMFFKMHTAAGTINAALPDLNRIAAMGYNIIWVLPVMKNRDPINNGPGPGLQHRGLLHGRTGVRDEPGHEEFRRAGAYARDEGDTGYHPQPHELLASLRPGRPRLYREASQYWTYYQHQFLGQGEPLAGRVTSDGFVYYNGFSATRS
jgi:hypothetical protein